MSSGWLVHDLSALPGKWIKVFMLASIHSAMSPIYFVTNCKCKLFVICTTLNVFMYVYKRIKLLFYFENENNYISNCGLRIFLF